MMGGASSGGGNDGGGSGGGEWHWLRTRPQTCSCISSCIAGVLGVLSGLLGLASSAVPQAKTAWKVGLGVVTGISSNVLGYYK